MNTISQLYDFLAGPCLFITVPLCLAGLARKTAIIISGRRNGLRFPALQNEGYNKSGIEKENFLLSAISFAGRDRFLAASSILFHISIIAGPLTAAAHGILLDQAWHLFPPRIDPVITGMFTLTALIAGLLLLFRRIMVSHVRAASTWRDYSAMTCVLIPFITGLLARKLIGPYEIVMIMHCAGAHILILAVGWTRLGHMIFFSAGRFVSSNLLRKIPI